MLPPLLLMMTFCPEQQVAGSPPPRSTLEQGAGAGNAGGGLHRPPVV